MIAALVAYGAAVLLVGLLSARRASRSPEAFLLGDRSFGLLATWAALTSTTIGGSTTLVLAALVARSGLPGLWLDLAGALGLLFLGLFLARKVRETGEVTLAAVVGRFYGERVRKIAAFLVVLAEIVWFALLAQATETVVTALTDWDPTATLVGTAALFVAYTSLGGQRAVVRTDLLQLGLMLLGIVGVALPLALSSLARTGWPKELLVFPVGPRFGWADAGALLVLVGLPHAVGSDVWAKLLSARDAATARRAALGAAAAPEATNTEPKAPAGCSAQSLDTLSELEFVQTCVQEKLDSDKLLAIIQSAKEAKKCGVAQRLYANRAQGGDTKIALIYAGEYDPKYHQASECFKEADKDTAAYWYETVLQSEPENQTAKQHLEELAK